MDLLITEDDPVLRRALASALRAREFRVHSVPDAGAVLLALNNGRYDVVLLDLGLPDRDGLSIIPEIRVLHTGPIIVVSARRGQDSKVAALERGADDYLRKPFGLPELVARIRAQARRAGLGTTVQAGSIVIDERRKVVTGLSGPIALTATEWAVLVILARARGSLVSTEQLLIEVWDDLDRPSNVRTYINLLRRKLEPDPAEPRVILHETGRGYRLAIDHL